MTITPKRKIDRINKKVIPHLKRAINYYQKEQYGKSENELLLAISNYKKEKTLVIEIAEDFGSLYNNLGVHYLANKDYKKAFTLFSKSLTFKIEIPSINIKGTYGQMVTAGLLCCEFDALRDLLNRLMEQSSGNEEFMKNLVQSMKLIETTQNNEPPLMIAGMKFANNVSSLTIYDFVYYPKAFEDIEMILSSDLTLSDHATLECSFVLRQQDSQKKIPIPYVSDSWKKMKIKTLEPRIKDATPNFTILLSPNEHIPINTVKISDKSGSLVEFDFNEAFTEFYIPESYPRFGFNFGNPMEIPLCKSFKYFRGKASILEWEMKSGEEYKIYLEVKNYEPVLSIDEEFKMRIGLLMPFKKIRHEKIFFKHTNKITIDVITQKRISFFNDRERPSSYSFKLDPDSTSEKQFNKGFVPTFDAEKYLYNLVPIEDKDFEDYSVFGVLFHFRVSPETLSIATVEWEQPVPTALSHMLLDRKFSFPPLCHYSIINNSKNERSLTFKTKIGNFTDKLEETKTILPYSVTEINHSPLFSNNIVSKLDEIVEADMNLSVLEESQLIRRKNVRTSLLAFDTMIFEILNPLNHLIFNLHDFLAVWVTPHEKEVENVISIAKEYHPQRSLEGYSKGLTEQETSQNTNLQCEAIFMGLKELGISYIDASLSFGWLKPFAFQRVKLPATSIKTKAANCIDGTVLFASLLEHIGLQPIMVLVPGHAFVGWKIAPNSTRIVFLETTQIASGTFETAIKYGRISLDKGLNAARSVLSQPSLSVEQAINRGIIRFIDVSRMRENGIMPQFTV